MGMRTFIGSALAALILPSGPAFAHAGFLLPNSFHVAEGGIVTVVASFSDAFPNPEIALTSTAFSIMSPDGQSAPFDRAEVFSTLTLLEGRMGTSGVYRLSSGERLGRKGEIALIESVFVRLGPDDPDPSDPPPDAKRLTSQTATVSETIVIVGDAGWPASLETSGRLAIRVVMDRDPLRTEAKISAFVTFDGQPLAGADLAVIEAYDATLDKEDGDIFHTRENGEALISLDRTGPFTLLVRHISEAPDGAETDVRSYSTTLTLPGW